MKSFRKELWMEIPARRGFVNLTPEVDSALRASGIREGLCLVNAMHITASVFINDNEGGLHRDFERWLEKLAPEKPYPNGLNDNYYALCHIARHAAGSANSISGNSPCMNLPAFW